MSWFIRLYKALVELSASMQRLEQTLRAQRAGEIAPLTVSGRGRRQLGATTRHCHAAPTEELSWLRYTSEDPQLSEPAEI